MGRHIGPVCRLCRREGLKLYLKGSRCDTPKCAVDRREGVPGMHQFRRSKASEYSVRLREKQKVKRYYGIFERQFRKYFDMAGRGRGQYGRRPDVDPGAPARQRRDPPRLRDQPTPGPPVHHARAHPGQRPQARHPELPRPPRRSDHDQGSRPLQEARRRRPRPRWDAARSRLARPDRHRARRRVASPACRRPRTSPCR